MFFFWSPELHSSFGLEPLLYGSVFLPSSHKEELLHVIEISETKFQKQIIQVFLNIVGRKLDEGVKSCSVCYCLCHLGNTKDDFEILA